MAVMYAGVIVETGPSSTMQGNAKHPYTAALHASRPSTVEKSAPLAIPGRTGSGVGGRQRDTPFAPRCAFAEDVCRLELPTLRHDRRPHGGVSPGRGHRRRAHPRTIRPPVRSVISVTDLRKSYRLRDGTDLVAVAGVSFSVDPGRSLAIVGQSGSGKSTCARIIAGIERQTSGSVELDGRARGP